MTEPLSRPEPVASPLAALGATPVLARQTLAYAFSGMLGPAIGLITLPILARVFTREEYGLAELGLAVSTVALTLTDAGFTAAAQRSYYDYRDYEEEMRRSVLFTAFVATTLLAATFSGAMLALREPLSGWLFSTGAITLLAIIAASLVPANSLRFFAETMRLRFQAWQYFITSTLAAVLSAALGLTAVLAFDRGVEGLFLGTLAGSLVAAVYGFFVVRHGLRGSFSKPELRTMLAYGLPLVPSLVAAWALALVDRIILGNLEDLAAVGQYAIANRLSGILLIGITAFLLALQPFLMSLYADDPGIEKAARGRSLTYMTFILSLAALLLTLFAEEIIFVAAPRFDDAYKAVGPLAFGMVAYGLSSVLATGLLLARQTIQIALFAGVAAAVNIGLNFALIPPLGFVGAAIAAAFGYVVLATSYYWIGQRVYPTPYEPQKALVTVSLAAALCLVALVPISPVALALAVKACAVLAFLVAVKVGRLLTSQEFAELWSFVREMSPLKPLRLRS